jgi:hypothetical protein
MIYFKIKKQNERVMMTDRWWYLVKSTKRLVNNLYKWKISENKKINVYWWVKKYSEKNKILFIYLFDDKRKNDCMIHIKHIYIHTKKTKYSISI